MYTDKEAGIAADAGWKAGDKARYVDNTYEPLVDLPVTILNPDFGWWKVEFPDGSTASVRPDKLQPSEAG